MRIAINHTDPEHPNATKFAFRLGRAQDGTDFVTGEERSRDDTVGKLLEVAKAEYPEADGYTHVVETLVDNGDDTSTWTPVDATSDSAAPSPAGEVQSVELQAPVEVRVSE